MLSYEHQRTEQIVEQLIRTEGIIRLASILCLALVLGAFAYLTARPISSDAALFAGVIGGLVGAIIGKLTTLLISAGIEWMAQSLIAQGEILSALKNSHDK